MRRTKRLGALLIALAMLFTMIPLMSAGAVSLSGSIVLTMNSTEFTVNGTRTKIDAEGSKPVQSRGYTMLPLRAILEATGGTLTYDANTQKITIVRGGDTVVLTLNSKTAVVNGANRTLGAAPYATNNRTMVHIRTLELFGMRVDWDEKTNNVTVNYVEPSRVYNLTLQNGMGTAYTGVYLAPQGTQAGAAAESGNLLGADTLQQNGNIIVQAPISASGTFQLRCTYIDPSTSKTQQHIIQNINLTGITDRATILMNSATSPSVTIDGAAAGDRTITLYVVNNTGKTLSALYSRQSGAQYYDQTNLLGAQLLVSGGQASFAFTYSSNSPYYDFVATCAPSGTETYSRVAIGTGLGAQTFQTIRLGEGGVLDNGTSASTAVETKVTFENESDDTVKGVIFSVSDKTESKWESADKTFSKISDGSSKSTTMDLSESRRWYVCVLDEDGDYLSSERLDFGSTSLKSLTITWDGDEFDFETDTSSKDDDDDTDGYGGNTDLVLANIGDTKFADIVVIPQDDYDDLSSYTYSKIKNKGTSLGSLKAETIKAYHDVFKYKEEDYYICFFTSTSKSEYEYGEVRNLSSKSKFVTVICEDDSTPVVRYYTAEDDDVLFWVNNKNDERVDFESSGGNTLSYSQKSFGDDYFYAIGDVDDGKVTIFNEDEDYKTTSKLSGYDYHVVIVKVTSSSVTVSGL